MVCMREQIRIGWYLLYIDRFGLTEDLSGSGWLRFGFDCDKRPTGKGGGLAEKGKLPVL